MGKKIPGNSANVSTARTAQAQQKLHSDAKEAHRVLLGNVKNVMRTSVKNGILRKDLVQLSDNSAKDVVEEPSAQCTQKSSDTSQPPVALATPLAEGPQL